MPGIESTWYLFKYDNGAYLYRYENENRLIKSEAGGSTVATYSYDFAGRRISKTIGPATTTYIYDGDQVIAEYNDTTLLRKFVYGPGIDEPLIMIIPAGQTNAGWYWYHYDGLGSVVALSDSSGSIVEAYSYDVFGAVTVHTADGVDNTWLTSDDTLNTPSDQSDYGNPYRFTGRRYDEETGLYYYRARMYDPATGRFLQTDPIGYADSMNLYQYCGNNPVNWIDPWGLTWFDNTSNFFSGMGDVISFGLTKKVRQWTGIDGEVDKKSGWYCGGQVAGAAHGIAMGGGRLAYAGAAKAGSIVNGVRASRGGVAVATRVAKDAVRYRNGLKTVFRGGKTSFRMYTYANRIRKYETASELIKATGRTSKLLNTAGGAILINGVQNLSGKEKCE